MTWVRLDDQFPDHPKIVAVGPLAGWLHMAAICYCNRQLTDGFIPAGLVPRLADVPDVDALVDALVTNHLWGVTNGGYQIHDYLEYNPSAVKIKEQRKLTAARQARWKERKNQQTDKRVSNASANGVTNAATSHPILYSSVSKDTEAAPTAKSKKQAGLAPLFNAFDEAGFPRPLVDEVEAKASNTLLKNGVTPSQIVECWQDITSGQWGDGWLRMNLSFAALVSHQRIKHYLAWAEAGKPPELSGANPDGQKGGAQVDRSRRSHHY